MAKCPTNVLVFSFPDFEEAEASSETAGPRTEVEVERANSEPAPEEAPNDAEISVSDFNLSPFSDPGAAMSFSFAAFSDEINPF